MSLLFRYSTEDCFKMSVAGELVQIAASSCFRWTVDVRHKPDWDRRPRSSVFRFQGHEWRLYYHYLWNKTHRLVLEHASPGVHSPIAFSVQVECGGRPGIVAEGLSQEGRIHPVAGWESNPIWWKPDSDVRRMCPEFQTQQELRFLVKLTGGDALLDTALTSSTTQTEDIAESRPVASASFQTECHLPGAPGQSTRTASTSVQTTLLLNTPSCLESLSQDLSQMLDQGSDPDMEFQCGGVSTRAHGALVSVRSEVISSMLSSDMLEGRTRVVKISNMQPDVFQHFLRYLYTGTLPELTVELALALYESGDQYAVLGLARRCSQYLVEHLSAENACRVLVVADAHSSEEFKESVIAYMLDNEIPLSGEDWRDFSDAHPKLANEVLYRFCLKLKQR